MKKVFQIYVPQWYRSYGAEAIKMVTKNLPWIKCHDGAAVWLIGLWDSDWSDIGFSIREYKVNPLFGTPEDLDDLLRLAYEIEIEIGCDIVPNHMSIESRLVQNATADMLYVVDSEEAASLSAAGVPSFFGVNAYSKIQTKVLGEFYARTKFADGHQFDLNWESPKIRDYFRETFRRIQEMGFSFVRVDCAELLLENVTRASVDNPLACMRSEESIRAIIEVAGDMKLFLECFNPEMVKIDFGPNVYVVDCSFVITGGTSEWIEFESGTIKYRDFKNYVPLLGGHDQMPFDNRFGIPFSNSLIENWPFDYIFTDIATEVEYCNTATEPTEEDAEYDTALNNPSKRWLGRFPITNLK